MDRMKTENGRNELSTERLQSIVEEQKEVISMMQIQLDLQQEKLDKHDKLIESLVSTVNELKQKNNPEIVKNDSKEAKSISEIAKETAEQVLAQPDYTFDEQTGLYYDRNSGYYYDPARQLFYNGHTKTYYTWNAETSSYVGHSQLTDGADKVSSGKKERTKLKKKRKVTEASVPKLNSEDEYETVKVKEEFEDGEISDASSQSEMEEDEEDSDTDDTITSDCSDSTTESRRKEELLPCFRAVVTETTIESMTKGYLFIVTCMGGSIGREGSKHSILIPDDTVSKHHADVSFSHENEKYYITDLGSQNGTYLNGERISEAKEASSPQEISHGSTLKIGGVTMLVHLHPGTFTCGLCEPGLLISDEKKPMYDGIMTKEDKERLRKKEMRKLQKKYGLEGVAFTNQVRRLPKIYKDRAQDRRVTKGSDNPYEKTIVASMDEAIKETNKGFQMLAKMGWSSGKALGRSVPQPSDSTETALSRSGIIEPVKVELHPGRLGLGYETGLPAGWSDIKLESPFDDGDEVESKSSRRCKKKGKPSKNVILKKTVQRFNQIS